MDVTNLASDSGDFVVLVDHLPKDPTEHKARVLFLTAGLGILCSKTLKEYMDHCTKGGGKREGPDLTLEQYSAAVKELLTVSIWLTLFEQSPEAMPDWFKKFIFECHLVSDKVQPEPPSTEMNDKYDLNAGVQDICTAVSLNLCNQLSLGATANDAMLYLGDLLMKSQKDRKHLLEFAMTQPVSALDQKIKQG